MKAMILKKIARIENKPLQSEKIAIPEPGRREIRIKISSCGVCHTDLDEIEGRLKSIFCPSFPDTRLLEKWKKTVPKQVNSIPETESGLHGYTHPAANVIFV